MLIPMNRFCGFILGWDVPQVWQSAPGDPKGSLFFLADVRSVWTQKSLPSMMRHCWSAGH